MVFEYRFFKLIPKNKEKFIQSWLEKAKFRPDQGEKRSDIYIYYPGIPFELQNKFGLKFRDIKSLDGHYFTVKKLELKQNFETTKKKKEKWKKLMQDKFNSSFTFSIDSDYHDASLSQFDQSSQNSQQQNENQASQSDNISQMSDFSHLGQSQLSEDSNFEIIKEEQKQNSQNNNIHKFNDVLKLKSEFNTQEQQNTEEKEEKSISEFEVISQQQQQSQNSELSQNNNNNLGQISEDDRLDLQMGILELLSKLLTKNKENEELSQYYQGVANSKGNFDLVLVNKMRFDDELSEQTFVELQILTRTDLHFHLPTFVSTNIEVPKKVFKTQKVIDKIADLQMKLNEYEVMSYPEIIHNFINNPSKYE